MRFPRKSKKQSGQESPSEDTQEMFMAGSGDPGDGDAGPEETAEPENSNGLEETKEYVAVAEASRVEESPEEDLAEEETEVLDSTEEEWSGDGYEEWDEEETYEGEPDEGAGIEEGSSDKPDAGDPATRGEDLKAWFAEFRSRTRAVGSGLLARIGAIRLPNHEINGQKVLAVAGVAAIALLVGGAGYVIGKGSGEDLDTARLEGEFAGRKAGAVAGATRGYAAGFKRGRDVAFQKSYAASYRRNYIRAYEEAGMEAPKPEDIEVPEP